MPRKKLFTSLTVIILLAGLFSWFFYKEAQKILKTEPNSWTEDQSADCGVVLTGGSGRVREGFDLLARGAIKKLIISGVYPGAKLREILPEWPYYGKLKPEDVILEKHSLTSYGNARQTLPLIEALNCQNLVLITSTLHMYRAQRIFRAVYPRDLEIYPRAIVANRLKPTLFDLSFEVSKSLFYSLWAY